MASILADEDQYSKLVCNVCVTGRYAFVDLVGTSGNFYECPGAIMCPCCGRWIMTDDSYAHRECRKVIADMAAGNPPKWYNCSWQHPKPSRTPRGRKD